MKYCKVVAIMNITDYNTLHVPIQQLDVPGVTVSMVKGFGDYVNDFSPFGFSDNMKLEIYTTAEQAETIATELSALADQLTAGGVERVVLRLELQDRRGEAKLYSFWFDGR